jgi:hypothetical protein
MGDQFQQTKWTGYETRLYYEPTVIDPKAIKTTIDIYINDLFRRCAESNILLVCASTDNNPTMFKEVGGAIQNFLKKNNGPFGNVVVVHDTRNMWECIPVFKRLGGAVNVVRSSAVLFMEKKPPGGLFDCYSTYIGDAMCATSARQKLTNGKHTDKIYYVSIPPDIECASMLLGFQMKNVEAAMRTTGMDICFVSDKQARNVDLVKQSWFTHFVKIRPSCARGRLIQFTGTCWVNSALNIILLTPVLAARAKRYFESQHKEWSDEQMQTKYDMSSCMRRVKANTTPDDHKKFVKHSLHTLVYNILIKGRKSEHTNGNFPRELGRSFREKTGGAFATCNTPVAPPADFIKLEQSEGYYPDRILTYILSILYVSDVVHVENDVAAVRNSPSVITVTHVCTLTNPRKSFDRKKTINGVSYTLQAALIDPEDSHVIAGLVCGPDSYVFDSHNYLAYCDWPNNDYSMYLSMAKQQPSTNGALCNAYPVIEYAVYVKTELVDAVEIVKTA